MPARWWSRRSDGAQASEDLSDLPATPTATRRPFAGDALLPDDTTRPDDPIIERGSFAHGVCPTCGWQGPARRARSAARKDVTKHGSGRCGSSASYPVHLGASPVTSSVAGRSGQE